MVSHLDGRDARGLEKYTSAADERGAGARAEAGARDPSEEAEGCEGTRRLCGCCGCRSSPECRYPRVHAQLSVPGWSDHRTPRRGTPPLEPALARLVLSTTIHSTDYL